MLHPKILKTEIVISVALLAVVMSLTFSVKTLCAAGACDTEDFYPSSYILYKSSYTDSTGKKDVIYSHYQWSSKSKYFQSGYWFSFDYYRTVSCSDGTDKDVYDFFNASTNLPAPVRKDIEEWNPWNPICYIVPRLCNEEAEIGTESPQNIQLNTWYYLHVYFNVKREESYGMRIEPEVETAGGTTTTTFWEDWCLLACYNTRAGSSGW
ncbi:MAG: hypothetical protein ACPL3C_08225 [Pyrobaculum sp.]